MVGDEIEVIDLFKSYPGCAAVQGVSFTVRRGEFFGLLGPNGAGKTSIVEILAGLRRADSGSVSVCGVNVVRTPAAVKPLIGIQLQQSAFFDDLNLQELLRLFASFYRRPVDPAGMLDLVGLRAKARSSVDKLSGGEAQRFAIAVALVNRPRVLFLDEPTAGLDPAARRQNWAVISELHRQALTIVFSTHYMEEAQALCQRVAIMNQGRMVALGTPQELMQSHRKNSLEEVFLAVTGNAAA